MSLPVLNMDEIGAEGSAAMALVFDMFKRKNLVRFYRNDSEVVVTADSNYNADFYNPYLQNIVRTADFQDFECRILYTKKPSKERLLSGGQSVNIAATHNRGEVRLQFKREAFDFLEHTKIFWLEGFRYTADSDFRMIGVFQEFEYFEVVLTKEE